MKNTILIFCLLLVSMVSHGQDNNENYGSNKICIKVAPLALLDTYGGSSYRGGTEFKLFNNFSFALECGSYFRNINGLTNIRGYTIKSELKFYLDRNEKNTGRYFSMEYFYKRQNYNFTDSFQGPTTYFKTYNINKYITALTIKYGVLEVSKKGFLFDAFVGLGIRFRNVTTNLNNGEEEKCLEDSQITYFENTTFYKIVPNIDLGIKIGYRIR